MGGWGAGRIAGLNGTNPMYSTSQGFQTNH
jgi:hypothetical protein